jgi:hypothetical protein
MKYQANIYVKISEKESKIIEFPLRKTLTEAENDEYNGKRIWEESFLKSEIKRSK